MWENRIAKVLKCAGLLQVSRLSGPFVSYACSRWPKAGKFAPKAGERALIRQIRARAGKSTAKGLVLGIGDDCALLRPGAGEELAVTTDLSIAGRHFLIDLHPPEVIGHRALARGLSDLAAMGARPWLPFFLWDCLVS